MATNPQQQFDVVVIGGGPGGYIAAIRATQLGHKVAIIEKERLGGVCLNKGCIPTKALLKSAHALHEVQNLATLGIQVELKGSDMAVAVKRANAIADRIAKGVEFLMKKNKIEVFMGVAAFKGAHEVEVVSKERTINLMAKNFIIATGAKYRTFPGLEHDGKKIIGAWEAIKLEKMPKSMAIIGGGAIGVEFAYFWNAFGVEVHLLEQQSHLLPIEDEDSSLEVEKAYLKNGVKLYLGVEQISAQSSAQGVTITYSEKGVAKKLQTELCLLAVGMTGSFEGLNLEKIGVKTEKGFIAVNSMHQTTLAHIYAIGDVSGPPLLAHAASHEGVLAVEHLSGLNPHAINALSIPGCTYCYPQVASIGKTEKQLKEQGTKYKVGKIPFSANGKAVASNEREGHVKVLMGEYGELLGAHIVGAQATELIHEYVLMRQMEGIDEDIIHTVHPHPTLGEFLSEAVLVAKGRALNY